MYSTLSILGTNLGVVLALMFCVWLLSLLKNDTSIVDIFWGVGFVLVAWLTFGRANGYTGRRLLIVLLTSLWGLRLSLHILLRNWGKGEDPRYRAMRARDGQRFWLVSLFTVFLLQGSLLWIISLVVQVGQLSPVSVRLIWLDGVGAGIWAVGFIFETVGDWQLVRFRNNPANEGKIMNRGLWAYSRHPNYFGESLIWWGMFIIALANPGNAWVVISPLLMTFLLLKVSGVDLLEKSMVDSHPGYANYMRSTSAFIPWFSKKGR